LQRRVRDDAAVPIELAVDSAAGKPGGSEPLAMTCSRPDLGFIVVEVDEVAGLDVGGADAEAHFLGIDPVEIDQPFEQRIERRDVVVGEVRRDCRPA
jgi:hypothetical protein